MKIKFEISKFELEIPSMGMDKYLLEKFIDILSIYY